jgi:serine/threonine protein kinase
MAAVAICYPEDGGYLHVGSIGEGQQGSVSLVRSVRTGELRCRKAGEYALSFEGAEGESLCPEVANYREHEGVNKLYSYQHYQNDSTIRATMIHRFCSGGDLYALYMSYADQNLVVPERLIWRFLDQMLGTLDFLHRQCSLPVSHRDLFFGNILVNWPANPKHRPDFLISDLGYSMNHHVEGAKACSLEPWSRMLLRSDAETFATDYRDVSATAFFLMHGDKEDQRCKSTRTRSGWKSTTARNWSL